MSYRLYSGAGNLCETYSWDKYKTLSLDAFKLPVKLPKLKYLEWSAHTRVTEQF